jgi:hypothetical protein
MCRLASLRPGQARYAYPHEVSYSHEPLRFVQLEQLRVYHDPLL